MIENPIFPVGAYCTTSGYVHVGRWTQCANCGGIFAGEHYCGAPWQQRAADIPATWVPGVYEALCSVCHQPLNELHGPCGGTPS